MYVPDGVGYIEKSLRIVGRFRSGKCVVVAYLFTCEGNASVEDMYERVEPEDYLSETLKEPNPQITASDMRAFVKENSLQLSCGNLADQIDG